MRACTVLGFRVGVSGLWGVSRGGGLISALTLKPRMGPRIPTYPRTYIRASISPQSGMHGSVGGFRVLGLKVLGFGFFGVLFWGVLGCCLGCLGLGSKDLPRA